MATTPGLLDNGLVSAAQRRLVAAPGGGLQGGSDQSASSITSPFATGTSAMPATGVGGLQSMSMPSTLQGGPGAGVAAQQNGTADVNWTPPTAKTFDFNPKYANLDQGNLRNLANAQSTLNSGLAGVDANYNTQVTQADQLQKTALQRLQDRLFSQGIGQSGINLTETGRLNDQYSSYLNHLSQLRAGDIGNLRTQYGRTVNDVSTNREGLWQQEADENQAQQVQSQKDAADAAARQAEAKSQQDLQAQLVAAQQQALQRQSQYNPGLSTPSAGNVGGVSDPTAVYGSPEGQMRNYGQFLDYLNNLDMSNPNNFMFAMDIRDHDPNMPPELRQAALNRIANYNQTLQQQQGTVRGGRAY